MGAYVNGVYVPVLDEVGWDDEVSDFLTVSGKEHINVTRAPYGADPTGVLDSTAGIQAAIDALSTSGGTLIFPPGTYKITSSLILPITPSSPVAFTRWNIRGYGATLKATTAITIMKTSTPTDTSDAGNHTNRQYDIRGLSFLGNNTTGQKALQLIATYGSTVKGCVFSNLDYGLDCIFAISTRIDDCFFVTNVTNDILIRSATYGPGAPIWPGAGNDFTASNNTVVSNYHTIHSTGQATGIDVGGTGQCVIEDSVFEGLTPTISIRYSSNGSSNARTFTVRNCWFESGGASTYTCIALPNITQSVHLNHLRFLAGGSTKHIDVTGAAGTVYLQDCEFVATDPLIKQTNAGGTHWFSLNTGPDDLFTNAAYWSSVKPNLANYVGYQTSSGALKLHSRERVVILSEGDYARVTSDAAGTAQGLVVGNMVVTGSLRVAGSASATTPGSVVQKLRIEDTSGNTLGYLPIYSTIT